MTKYNFEDRSKKYFFHNVYGEENFLLETIPDNVISVPFGWTESIENDRVYVENQLNVTAFELPCVAFWTDAYQIIRKDEEWDGDMVENVPEHWHLLGIKSKIETPWTWEKINEKILNWEENKTADINFDI